MALTTGSRLGVYEIISALGAGGMGEVHRARDTKLNREVALKVLPGAFLLDADRLARFKRKAQVLAALDHPNIGAMRSTGSKTQTVCTRSCCSWWTAPRWPRSYYTGPILIDEALAIGKQVAEALEAAHEKGIIHRDLKPANIKVRSTRL